MCFHFFVPHVILQGVIYLEILNRSSQYMKFFTSIPMPYGVNNM